MFGRFLKAKTPSKMHFVPEQPNQPQGLQKVVVRQSAFDRSTTESWYLVSAVVDFVNAMNDKGIYRGDEVPTPAIQSYHADYYLAQVNNGGHSQFIHNCGENYGSTTANALAGLRAMGADVHLGLLEQMMAWVDQNPSDAKAQTGFSGGRAALLDELDSTFYAAEKPTPMADLNANWIRSWPILQVVQDDNYDTVIQQIAMQNPKRDQRIEARAIVQIAADMSVPMRVAIGIALARCPEPNVLMRLGAGSYQDIDGTPQMVLTVQTARGPAFIAVDDAGVAVHEHIMPEGEPMPGWEDREKFSKALLDGTSGRFKTPHPGKRLATAQYDEAADFAKLAETCQASVALYHLLWNTFGKVEIDGIGPRPKDLNVAEQKMTWTIIANGGVFGAIFTAFGATLMTLGANGRIVERAGMDEIKARMSRLSDEL